MKLRATIGMGAFIAFLAALTLASAPQLHEYLHKDAAQHECAATVVASGNYHHLAPPSLLAAAPLVPVAPTDCAPTFDLFAAAVSSSILEHAPPVAL